MDDQKAIPDSTSLPDLARRLISYRGKRSITLIADFKTGLALGWKMAVPVVFRDALDIKLTERMIKKEKKLVWTQGIFYNFMEGDIVHNDPALYESWPSRLEKSHFSLQILKAKPATLNPVTGAYLEGGVRMQFLKPNASCDALIPKAQIDTTQVGFVSLLKSGICCVKPST